MIVTVVSGHDAKAIVLVVFEVLCEAFHVYPISLKGPDVFAGTASYWSVSCALPRWSHHLAQHGGGLCCSWRWASG
jgi:hypothetical protein